MWSGAQVFNCPDIKWVPLHARNPALASLPQRGWVSSLAYFLCGTENKELSECGSCVLSALLVPTLTAHS